MARVLITGGTGLVGKRLTQMLIDNNHEVLILSRNPTKNNEFNSGTHKVPSPKVDLICQKHFGFEKLINFFFIINYLYNLQFNNHRFI